MQPLPLTRRSILAQAWQIMLGQVTIPLVGLVDTAVIGRTGDAAALAGVALGVAIINMLFWSFGFLRMGMTGLTAQAQGAGDGSEVERLLLRGLVAGLMLGGTIIALQLILVPAVFALLSGGGAMDRAAHAFVAMRLLGAPAALSFYAINGWLYGLGRTRDSLILQVVMNAANIGLDILFVWHFGMGAAGVGLGTALAEWVALASGLLIVRRGGMALFPSNWRAALLVGGAWRRLMAVNGDIMIRTMALLALFLWLANAGARLGPDQLAGNHVLQQLVSLFAFVLDGFAFTAETRIGMAIGAGRRAELKRAIRLTGEFSFVAATMMSAAALCFGHLLIATLTSNAEVQAAAQAMLPLAAMTALVGVPAWLLDGIFIGATRGRALRNAALVATGLYIATDYLLRPWGALGLWIAFLLSYAYRAVSLGVRLPALIGSVEVAKSPHRP